ncbi:uncharacterized protein LOC129909670 [Episyrphus balteatus]|uniref:uncharacterized protein LOC129909670 n=1 Tax=Episyrphus balteatus TaxID=286459 RepID=UPI0024867E01|nr:uncharacterized protein LOC129909670 [Episyrphus balteatus]
MTKRGNMEHHHKSKYNQLWLVALLWCFIKLINHEPKKRVNLKHLSNEERLDFINSFDQVFCDVDGVIWQTTQAPIPDAGKAIEYLRSIGKDVIFVTNNSIRVIEDQLLKLEQNHVIATKEQVIHPAQSIADYLKEIEFEGLIYCIASGPFKKTLRSAGFEVTDGPNRMLEETIQDLAVNIFCNDPVKAVVIDVDFNLCVAKLMRAHRYLKNPNCLFLGGAADLIIPLGTKDIIGPGPFINVVEQTTKRKAIVLGKPGVALSDFLKKRYTITEPKKVLFIGDTLGSDVKFGNISGFQTLVVLSGGTTRDDLFNELPEDETPDFYVDSLADLNNFIIRTMNIAVFLFVILINVLVQLSLGIHSTTHRLPKPRHILDLSPEEKIEFIQSIDLVLSDIDGVVWNVVTGVDGAAEGFKSLIKSGKKVFFVTNNSARSDEACEKSFKDVGLEVNNSDIISPAKNVVKYLLSINFDGLIYCIGTDVFKGTLRKAGFRVIDGPTKIFEESFSALARHIFDKEPVRAVVVDVDFNLSGAKMIRAHQYLRHPDCLLIGGATDLFLPVTKDIQILGPGPYVKVLSEASGKTPIIMAKPGKQLADMLIDRLDIQDKSRAIMIGDMLEQDIGFGKVAGLQTLLVLSGGCTKEQMLENTNPDIHPDYYADSMYDFVKFFESSKL